METSLYEPNATWVAVAGLALAVWAAVIATIAFVRWPKRPDAGPWSSLLRSEPPAVANLLVNGWFVTQEALPATLLDLAARGHIDIEDRGGGEFVCKVQELRSGEELRDYEEQILEHLRRRSHEGVVPAGALTTGRAEESSAWWKTFRKAVANHATELGLAQELWPRRLSLLLAVGAVPVYLALQAAQGFKDTGDVHQTAAVQALNAGLLIGALTLIGLAGMTRLRDTVAGREACAEWLGVKTALSSAPSFPDLPPTAIATWERHLGYGVALGVAAGAARALPLGAEHDNRAWTHFGGDWRLVNVDYPRLRPGWGLHPGVALLLAAFQAAIGYWVLRFAIDVDLFDIAARTGGWGVLIAIGLGGLFVLFTAWVVVGFVWALIDLGSTSVVRGEVVRTRIFNRSAGSSDGNQKLYFVAVYSGEGEDVVAWRVSAKKYTQFYQGQLVTAEVTKNLCFLKRVEPSAD